MKRYAVYILPGIHLCVALFATVGVYIQQVASYPSRAQDALITIDMPVSFVFLILAWGSWFLAAAWLVIVGTLWWYWLSKGIARLIRSVAALT